MKLQTLREKIIRYCQIVKYYGVKRTVAYYLAQQSETKFYDFHKKILLDFVLKLRKEAQIDESSNEIEEVDTEFPKIIWTMWQQGEAQIPETVKASLKTIKDFAKRNGCELHLLTDENLADFINIPKDITLVERRNPTVLMKAIKNEVELKHTIQAHVKDGIAHTKFIYWLKQLVKQGVSEQEDELSASDKLVEFRKEQGGFICPSFAPICGHAENGAIIHYSSSKETSIPLRTGTFFLTDTGAHYEEGSTDITRTTAMGEVSDKLKRDYTRVLQCHLRLSRLKFLEGMSGANVDLFARAPLMYDYENFNHGTGHGVGYLGNIHEGPQGIHWGIYRAAEPFKDGMTMTNEPGLYISGSHGIRLENELIIRNTVKNEYGQFMEFEVMTFVPWDLEAIDVSLLTSEDKYELNNYHKKVFEVLAPHFEGEELEWLKQATREV